MRDPIQPHKKECYFHSKRFEKILTCDSTMLDIHTRNYNFKGTFKSIYLISGILKN
jgi:hypothetical protein